MRFFRDRIGTHLHLGPWWCHLAIGWHPASWHGTLYIARKRIWCRPIDYKAIETHV